MKCAVPVKIVQPPVEKQLFLLQLRNESHCRSPTYLLLKLITMSVLVLSFRPKSNVVQVLLKEKRIHPIFHMSKLSNQPSKRIFTKKSKGFFDIVNISLNILLFE